MVLIHGHATLHHLTITVATNAPLWQKNNLHCHPFSDMSGHRVHYGAFQHKRHKNVRVITTATQNFHYKQTHFFVDGRMSITVTTTQRITD